MSKPNMYGHRVISGKNYFSYNSWHMNGKTHGQYLKQENVIPIEGNATPVRKSFNDLLGCNVYIVEVLPTIDIKAEK